MNFRDYSTERVHYYDDVIPVLLIKYLKLINYENIIDCGCGDGSLLSSLKKYGFLKNKRIYAIDLAKNRLDLVKMIDGHIIIKKDNAEILKTIEDRSIDFYISTQVIEHVNDKKMIDTIHRVVKRKGIVYLSTVYKKWYGWFYYRNKNKWVLDPTHIREYTKDRELLDLFDEKKFQILETKKSLFWYPLVHFISRRVGMRKREIFTNKIFSTLCRIKIPIIGYYNWELIIKKYND